MKDIEWSDVFFRFYKGLVDELEKMNGKLKEKLNDDNISIRSLDKASQLDEDINQILTYVEDFYAENLGKGE